MSCWVVMFRNEHGHFVTIGKECEFDSSRKAYDKAAEKAAELKTKTYALEVKRTFSAANAKTITHAQK